MVKGYCVRDRKSVEMQDPVQITLKTGRPAVKGVCPLCQKSVFRIGKLEAD